MTTLTVAKLTTSARAIADDYQAQRSARQARREDRIPKVLITSTKDDMTWTATDYNRRKQQISISGFTIRCSWFASMPGQLTIRIETTDALIVNDRIAWADDHGIIRQRFRECRTNGQADEDTPTSSTT